MKKQNKIYLVVVILVAAFLATAGILAYIEYVKTDDKEEKKSITTKEIDNRISPLTNQGLIIEVLRIRHRGFLDKLLSPGISWKQKPEFYYITNLDGVSYDSSNVQGGAAQKGTFKTPYTDWDTIFQESQIKRKVEEEQESSEVTLTIVESVKSGLFGRKSTDYEREKITLTYDYRTGRWDGKDDSFMDDDGYGHYVGETFEIWFNIYQLDYDHDGIPYWTEVNVLDTNPRIDDSELDPDDDGIPTSWEWRWGYDPFTWDDHRHLDPDVDGIENIEEYRMSKWFADPFHQDIYIETDGTVSNGLFDPEHIFWKESQQAIIERFCQHGISIYIDDGWADGPKNGGGELLTHYDKISQDSGMLYQFYRHNFADERKGVFRYVLVSHNAGFNHPQEFNKYDAIAVGTGPPGNILSKLKSLSVRAKRIRLAQSIMHEIGHSIGIAPWTFEGCDNFSHAGGLNAYLDYKETWGQYVSVMNYFHIYDKNFLDYSDGSNGEPWDINDWEHIYLPTFQLESRVFEEAFFNPPCVDKIVDETLELEVQGWKYDEALTKQYRTNFNSESPVNPIDIEWFIMVKTDEALQPSDRNVRVYAKPIVEPTISEWTLSYEGILDSGNNVLLYSTQTEAELIFQQIDEMNKKDKSD